MVSAAFNFPNAESSFNRLLETTRKISKEADHCCSRAKRDIYACCVYRTSHGDYCLASDLECISEYTEANRNYFIILGCIFGSVIIIFMLVFALLYVHKRRINKVNTPTGQIKIELEMLG